jgi:hypothetical protein
MRRIFELGGLIAAAVLIALGIVAVVMGFSGRNTVNDSLQQEYIVGSPDMTPAAIKTEAANAKLPASVSLPTCSVAGQTIDTGDEARCFASYMRVHALEATGGYTYAQMGRFQAKPETPKDQLAVGGGTDNEEWAAIDTTTQQPISNGARNIWVTETALGTALNASYMADRISLFGILVGFTLLLTGLGFGILAVGGALRSGDTALSGLRKQPQATKDPAPTS